MSIQINLPSINGEIEAGITVSVDSTLPDNQKLPIMVSGKVFALHNVIKQNAVTWAYDQFTDNDARKLFVNGVAAIIDLGMVRTAASVPDGDWYKTIQATALTEEKAQSIANLIKMDDMKKAATVAVATKANYWLMNNHTGQGAVAGYVKKVLDVFFDGRITKQLTSAAHNLGHFTSTLYVLGIAGTAGLRETDRVTSAPGAKLTLSQDVKLRFSSMPAGTDRLAVAFEAAKRLVRSIYAPFCPNVGDFSNLPELRNSVIAVPSTYHIDAFYLTGRMRSAYADTDMEHYLGRLGTFITVLYKNSTLAKSPHMAIARVENYDDYDANFKHVLARIQMMQAQTRGRLIEEQVEAIRIAPEEVLASIRLAFLPPP